MLTARAVAGGAVAALMLLTAADHGGPGFGGHHGAPPPPPEQSVGGGASDGELVAEVTTAGSTVEGRPFSSTVHVRIPPTCWYPAYLTGAEDAAAWAPGGPSWVNTGNGGYSWERLVFPGYQEHAADTEGRWYTPRCSPDAAAAYVVE